MSTVRMLAAVMVFLTVAAWPGWSRGTAEDAWQEVEGTSNWRHEIDLSEHDPGVYNLIVRGRDFAGNEFIEGPLNIHIDPDSDLPISRVVFPEQDRIVRGDVNVVGIAEDDDALERVDIRIDDGPWRTADGSTYFRHFVDVENIEDGPHTITGRGVDVHGVEGREAATEFVLDTVPPQVNVTSHENGAIVSGRVRFDGVASDANDIALLALSRDDRGTFERVSTRRDGDTGARSFSFTVATQDLEDGATIYWLRATDSAGSSKDQPFLFFVDNESPAIRVISPDSELPQHDSIRIVGSIRDAVGIRRFWYRTGNEELDIPLEPGNPYWSVTVDTTARSGNRLAVDFAAEDTSGNVTEQRVVYELDQTIPLPRVRIDYPDLQSEAIMPPDESIYGAVQAADPAEAVIVTGLGGEDVEFPAHPAFRIPLDDAPVGRLRVKIRGRDSAGRVGPATTLEFVRGAPPPEIQVQSVAYADGEETSFEPGAEYDPLRTARLRGTIRTLARVDEVAAIVGETDADAAAAIQVRTTTTEEENVTSFSFELPPHAGYGVVPLTIRATDEFGAVSEVASMLFYRDLRRIEREPGFVVVDERVQSNGTILLRGGRPLRIRMVGVHGGAADRFENVRLEPAPDFLSVSSSGSTMTVTAQREGEASGVYLRAETAEGVAIADGPYTFASDRTPPEIELSSPLGQDLSGAGMDLSGTVQDVSGLEALSYSVDGGATFVPLETRGTPPEYRFAATVPFGDDPPEAVGLVVRAVDTHGNRAVARGVFNLLEAEPEPVQSEERKNDRPEVVLALPGAGSVAYAPAVLAGIVRDLDGTQYVEVAIGEGEFRRVASFDARRHHQPFQVELPSLGPGTHRVRVRAADRLGEESREVQRDITVASAPMEVNIVTADDAEAGLIVPLGDGAHVSGFVEQAGRLAVLRYRVNEGDWERVSHEAEDGHETRRSFRLVLSDQLPYGEHRLELQAEDREGNTATRRLPFYVLDGQPAPRREQRVVFADVRADRESLRFDRRKPLLGRFLGRPLRGVEVLGADGLISATADGTGVRLVPERAGEAPEVRLTVTTVDGLRFETRPRSLHIDLAPPELIMERGLFALHTKDGIAPSGTTEDDRGTVSVRYRLGFDGPFARLPLDGSTLSLSQETPGARHLFVRAEDAANKQDVQWFPIFYDPEEPEIRFITPPADDVVNGRTTVIGRATSRSPVVAVSYSLDGAVFEPLGGQREFAVDVDFSTLVQQEGDLVFRVADLSGNVALARPPVLVDAVADQPVVEIQIPREDAIITTDLVAGGMAFDDDGVAAVYYRIDEEPFVQLPGGDNFSIPIPLSELTDNEHIVEVYAEDMFGLAGPVVSRRFRVSLRAPDLRLAAPNVAETNRGTIVLRGTAVDANGIDRVELSLDNGNSTVLAEGREEWEYRLDSTVFTDGTYSLQTIGRDAYGIEGQYFTLVNIDNTPPALSLDVPRDGDTVSETLQINGRVEDAVQVAGLSVEVQPIGGSGESLLVDLPHGTVVQERLDISSLPDGWYTVQVVARDDAENETVVARNVQVQNDRETAFARLHFPAAGATRAGPLFVEGRVGVSGGGGVVQILVNGRLRDTTEANSRGYFRYQVDEAALGDGGNTVEAVLESDSGQRIASGEHEFAYRRTGPFVTITSHQIGDLIASRPWIAGEAGYPHDLDADDPEDRKALAATRVVRVLVSLDNGRTFHPAQGRESWRYRVETGEVAAGPLAILVRAEYGDGSAAVARTLVTVDKSPPSIALRSPSEAARVNGRVVLIGTARDENGVSDVHVALRPGDKAGYAVPSFVQGMYVDVHALGFTYFQTGIGLTFFDENVKFQGHFGVSPRTTATGGAARFAGYVFGGKILANVASVPFNTFFGPDWEFLSLNIALGATFNYVRLYEPVVPFGMDPIQGVVLSAIVGQIEFPKFRFAGLSAFNAYSLYIEPQVWFVPSDVRPDVTTRLTFGARVQLF